MFNRLTEIQKSAFISSLVFGFLAYGYMLTNKITSHDDIGALYTSGGGISNGRWMTGYYEQWFHMINSPWSNGVIVIFIMAVASVMLVKILNLQTKSFAIAVSAIWITYPCIASTLFYMFTAVPYVIGLSLTVLAAWLLYDRVSILTSQLAALCIIVSLGFYQAYFSVVAGLFLILLLQYILKDNVSLTKVLKRGVIFFIVLLEGMVGYIFVQNVLVYISGVALMDYQNLSSLGHIDWTALPQQIADAYNHFFNSWRFFGDDLPIFEFADYLVCLFLLMGFLYIIINRLSAKQYSSAALLFVIMLLFPLACNLVYLYGAEGVHSLMVQGNVCAVFLLFVLLSQIYTKPITLKISKRIVAFVCCMVILLAAYNCVLSSRLFLQQQYIVNASINYLSGVVTQIKCVEDYAADMPVALVGLCDDPSIGAVDGLYKKENLTGSNTMWQIVNTVIRQDWVRSTFFVKYLGFKADFVGVDACDELRSDPYIKAMPIYPNSGSIRVVDGIVVVHFSE